MDKLTLSEWKSIADSRMVDVENQLQHIKDNIPLWSNNVIVSQLANLRTMVEALEEAWDTIEDKELEMLAEEAEEKYKEVFN